jgi:DNA polymerase-3 subunit delta'
MSFHDIYGHKRQIAVLQKAIFQRRVGHAYLFSGMNAIGKKTLAVKFTGALNCAATNDPPDACDKCPSCLKMQHSSHSDVIFIEADGQFIRINAIREIQEQMKFKPLEGKWRAVIIDDADKMNDQAANALLKTLEEPSASNILILISSRPYSLPATIISRCRQMRFGPLPADTVAQFLRERMGMEQQKSQLLAGLCGGSIGKALELDREDVVTWRAQIMQLLLKMRKDDPLSLLNLALFFTQDKREVKRGLDILNSCFRDALIFKETQKEALLINQDNHPLIAAISTRLSGEQILRNIALIDRAAETIEMNVNKALTLETLAFKLN